MESISEGSLSREKENDNQAQISQQRSSPSQTGHVLLGNAVIFDGCIWLFTWMVGSNFVCSGPVQREQPKAVRMHFAVVAIRHEFGVDWQLAAGMEKRKDMIRK